MKGKIWFRTVAAFALTGVMLFGCGKDKEEKSTGIIVEDVSETVDAAAGDTSAQEASDVESADGTDEEVDITSLAEALKNDITYQDELTEIDLETASMIMSFGDAEIIQAVIYESSGATAEEIVVLQCASEEDAKKAAEALKNRVEEQKEAFEDYVPAELTKLADAVIETKGRVAVLSVSDEPETVRDILQRK